MHCINCGKKIDKNNKFCMFCGKRSGGFKNLILSNAMLLVMALISYALFLSCVCFYVFNSDEIPSDTTSIVLNILWIGIFFGFVHILYIAAAIVALRVRKRAMSLVCMGFSVIALFSTWLWNFWLTVDNVNMLDYPMFTVVLLIQAALSVVLCIFKFKNRILG